MPTFLTRRVTFAAAHRYRRPEWSEEENARVFGLCARENYHGHSYVCEVTVSGDVDPQDGTAAFGVAYATKDLPQATRKGGMLYVFSLP